MSLRFEKALMSECDTQDASAGKMFGCLGPMAWKSVSRVGAAGAKLTIAVSPSLPFSSPLRSFYLFTLCSNPLSSIFFRTSSPRLPPSTPCSTRHQVGSATLGCRAALRASSATACLRARGPGPSLQTSMKPFITWTGCSRVSVRRTSMNARDVFARCDVPCSPLRASLFLLWFVSHSASPSDG